jgi:hypothetical protein
MLRNAQHDYLEEVLRGRKGKLLDLGVGQQIRQFPGITTDFKRRREAAFHASRKPLAKVERQEGSCDPLLSCRNTFAIKLGSSILNRRSRLLLNLH